MANLQINTEIYDIERINGMDDASNHSSDAIPLSDLEAGETGIVKRIDIGSKLRHRLREMGFIPGTKVEVIRWAPLADPIEYRIRGYFISLRRDEAKDVLVSKLNGKGKRHRFRFGWRWNH